MKTTPLLMTRGNIIAIREERKTQTRRIVSPQPDWLSEVSNAILRGPFCWPIGALGQQCGAPIKSPFGVVGDIIALKETWWCWGYWHDTNKGLPGKPKWRWIDETDAWYPVIYDTDIPSMEKELPIIPRMKLGYHKQPSIYLPKEEWRTLLKITAIRIERLQDISEEDAEAEGVLNSSGLHDWDCPRREFHPDHSCACGDRSLSEAYKRLWDSINGKQKPGKPDVSWAANPWVWCISFRPLSPQSHETSKQTIPDGRTQPGDPTPDGTSPHQPHGPESLLQRPQPDPA